MRQDAEAALRFLFGERAGRARTALEPLDCFDCSDVPNDTDSHSQPRRRRRWATRIGKEWGYLEVEDAALRIRRLEPGRAQLALASALREEPGGFSLELAGLRYRTGRDTCPELLR